MIHTLALLVTGFVNDSTQAGCGFGVVSVLLSASFLQSKSILMITKSTLNIFFYWHFEVLF